MGLRLSRRQKLRGRVYRSIREDVPCPQDSIVNQTKKTSGNLNSQIGGP